MNDPQPTKLPLGESQHRFLILVAACVFLTFTVFTLHTLSALFQPFLIAIFFCYMAIPLRNYLQSHKIPPLLANILIPVVVIILLLMLVWLVVINSEVLIDHLPLYRNTVFHFLDQLTRWSAKLPPSIRGPIENWSPSIDFAAPILASWMTSLLSFFGTSLMVGFFMIFLLLESRNFPRRLQAAYGDERAERILRVVNRINRGVLSYIRIKAITSVIIASASMMILLLFQVDSWFLWTLATFVGNFIPYLGAVIVTALPVITFFLQTASPFSPIVLFVCLLFIQNYIGAYLEPVLAGKSFNISPLAVILGLVFWGWLWGIVGMLLAVPILVSVKITLENFEATRSVAILLGDFSRKPKD